MSPSEISTLVATIGFPIVAAWFLGQFTKSRIEAADKQAERREAVAEAREQRIIAMAEARETVLIARINHLEDTIREQLMGIITEARDMMCEVKESMSYSAANLSATTIAMQEMTDVCKQMKREQSTHAA